MRLEGGVTFWNFGYFQTPGLKLSLFYSIDKLDKHLKYQTWSSNIIDGPLILDKFTVLTNDWLFFHNILKNSSFLGHSNKFWNINLFCPYWIFISATELNIEFCQSVSKHVVSETTGTGKGIVPKLLHMLWRFFTTYNRKFASNS